MYGPLQWRRFLRLSNTRTSICAFRKVEDWPNGSTASKSKTSGNVTKSCAVDVSTRVLAAAQKTDQSSDRASRFVFGRVCSRSGRLRRQIKPPLKTISRLQRPSAARCFILKWANNPARGGAWIQKRKPFLEEQERWIEDEKRCRGRVDPESLERIRCPIKTFISDQQSKQVGSPPRGRFGIYRVAQRENRIHYRRSTALARCRGGMGINFFWGPLRDRTFGVRPSPAISQNASIYRGSFDFPTAFDDPKRMDSDWKLLLS